jgi:enolase
MPTIERVSAMEILDSRGRPTVQAALRLSAAATEVIASIPSGASTGAAEALELRDGDPKRYGGLGVRKAVENVNTIIARNIVGKEFQHQSDLDRALIELDGTLAKSRLGANAILSVSIAFARAHAAQRNVPLYQHFADMLGEPLKSLPRLTINLFSGGKHAGGQVPIQDVLVVPTAPTIEQGLAVVYDIYQAAAKLALRKYQTRALKADEGGLAPPFPHIRAMFEDARQAIQEAGHQLGGDVFLAVDVAASHFFVNGNYPLSDSPYPNPSEQMINTLCTWVGSNDIVSLEDGLAENDWAAWPTLTKTLTGMCIVVGDDLLCTNPARIRRAIEAKAANALLLKVNQIGTLTEAAEALKLARNAGWKVTISARSGETEDNWLADLAVGWAGDQIKVGSIAQSERLAKYNRLLAIEAQTNLPVVRWPAS